MNQHPICFVMWSVGSWFKIRKAWSGRNSNCGLKCNTLIVADSQLSHSPQFWRVQIWCVKFVQKCKFSVWNLCNIYCAFLYSLYSMGPIGIDVGEGMEELRWKFKMYVFFFFLKGRGMKKKNFLSIGVGIRNLYSIKEYEYKRKIMNINITEDLTGDTLCLFIMTGNVNFMWNCMKSSFPSPNISNQ